MIAVKIRHSQTEVSVPSELILVVLVLICETFLRVVALNIRHL